tara:strand:- start:84 stop:467 length:384 start_codon:yes stop_codon:yes gene_type:complete
MNIPSNKNFAYSFSFVFFVGALFFLYIDKINLVYLFLVISILFLITGKFCSKIFKYPNYIWSQFAKLLHKIISPIILFALFFFIFTPFGLIARIFVNDLKKIKGIYKKSDNSNFTEYDLKINYKNQF